MKKLILTGLFALLISDAMAQAQIRRRQEIADEEAIQKAETQLKFYMEELEKVKVKRWQDKRNSVAKKESFSDAWEELRREMDQLSQRKTQKESMLMRLDNQVGQMETEIKAQEDRLKDFGIQLSEKAGELAKAIGNGFPYFGAQQNIQQMHNLQQELESRGYHPSADALHSLFALHKKLFALGESREVRRDQFALEKVTPAEPAENLKNPPPLHPGIVAGYFVRLGTVYQAFISTESPDAAILAKSGNMSDKPWVWLERISEEKIGELQKARQQIILGDSATALLLPIDVILRKSTGKGYAAEEGESFLQSLKNEWAGAGFVIWFILGIVTIALVIVGEKIILVLFKGLGAGLVFRKVKRFVDQSDYDAAIKYCASKWNASAKVLKVILERRKADRHEAEEAAYASMLHETPKFERNINTINILASAAPLVGLLGTVSGMINLFAAITMHGTNDPKIMAAGIAEALLSTKWGLIVALPLMLIYNMTSNMVGKVVGDIEKYSATLINQIWNSKSDD